jgi:hypothetical protein
MAIPLAAARTAAQCGNWWLILGVEPWDTLLDVQKARRALQRANHPDKGGNNEMCQLINQAADNIEAMLDRVRIKHRKDQDDEEERRAREEDRQIREALERAEADARARRWHERIIRERRELRTKSNFLMIATVHQRTRNKVTLGEHAGRAFPVIYRRSCKLSARRKVVQSRILTYAVETTINSRRANREDKWPKTAGLDKRCPDLASKLARLKKAYDRAYQNLRYLRSAGKLHTHALLSTRRIMHEAWMLYLALPAPMRETVVQHA